MAQYFVQNVTNPVVAGDNNWGLGVRIDADYAEAARAEFTDLYEPSPGDIIAVIPVVAPQYFETGVGSIRFTPVGSGDLEFGEGL